MTLRTLRRAAPLALPLAFAACSDRDPIAPVTDRPALALTWEEKGLPQPGGPLGSTMTLLARASWWDLHHANDVAEDGTVAGQSSGGHPYPGGQTWSRRSVLWTPAGELVRLQEHPDAIGTESYAYAISPNGRNVVGTALLAEGTRAVAWPDRGALVKIGAFQSGDFSYAYDVNDAGTVVGRSGSTGYVWSGGVMTPIPTFGGRFSEGDAINNAGVVVGYAWDAGSTPLAFKWTPGAAELTPLPMPANAYGSVAAAINSRGDIVGHINTNEQGWTGAYWPASGGVQLLAKLPIDFPGQSYVSDISDAGLIVGQTGSYGSLSGGWTAEGYDQAAVVWRVTGESVSAPVLLEKAVGHRNSVANGVNAAGRIVGTSFTTDEDGHNYKPLVWRSFEASNVAPVATITGTSALVEGSVGSFSAAGSSDQDGDALSFAWDLDNDGAFDDATGATASYTFPDNGLRSVRVRVSDGKGGVSEAVRTVAVSNSAPTVTKVYLPFPALNTPKVGQAWTLQATFADRNANDGPFAVSADWGDGTSPLAGTVASPGLIGGSHVFTTPGAKTVTIRIVDKDGGVAIKTVPVNVQP